jgi:hypothetical protein|uniref:Uncharacterized protein n=1 Tax=Myoviridae sp. ctshb19 TaxID=2825194 RepID=A0A8S5UGK4_9CAUD|nr:MAG TPA: hypothetical protein [Myoviridae sp. ctshb19]
MTITGAQIGTVFLIAACMFMVMLSVKQYERIKAMRVRMLAAECKAMLLEVENAQLRNLNKFRSKYDTPKQQEQVGATFELCKKTGGWRVT